MAVAGLDGAQPPQSYVLIALLSRRASASAPSAVWLSMVLARHLVIFARRPRFGIGKSRLAAGAGSGTAWRFQRVMLLTLLQRLGRDPRWTTWLAVPPD